MRPGWLIWAALALALAVRLPGIGWGLPPSIDHVLRSDLRSSYAFDEDDILSGAAKASVARLDFDPYEYHWGTLHITLVLLTLDGAEALGAFRQPWRQAYYNLVQDDFRRVYVVGRLTAVAAALLTVWLLFQIPGQWAGPFAGLLIAVSPAHMLQSDQVRVDVTMTAMLVLTVLAALRASAIGTARAFLLLGLAAGLSIAAKYSAFSAVAAIAVAALALRRFPWRAAVATAAGTLLGFIAGSPYILVKSRAYYDEIHRYMDANSRVPEAFLISPLRLLELHGVNLVRFSMGVPAAALALWGLWCMLRRRAPFNWIVLAGIAGYIAVLFPLRWPMIRYDLPLCALLGICAGVAVESLAKPWRIPAVALALLMPLGGCLAQIHYMRAPQTANLALERILAAVPPGATISRLFREAPPLDEKTYPMGPNILMGDLRGNSPAWALTCNLPDMPYPEATLALLRERYEETARFRTERILGWATLGEADAPHDWKYTHPEYVLYRRKAY